jgi:uncharacterized protein (DUF433 family)
MTLLSKTHQLPLTIDSEGVARIGKTRVTLDTVVVAFMEGATAEEIAQQYPSLSLSDIYSVIGYYLRKRSEVDKYLRQRQKQAELIRKTNEGKYDPSGIRDRLLAKRK